MRAAIVLGLCFIATLQSSDERDQGIQENIGCRQILSATGFYVEGMSSFIACMPILGLNTTALSVVAVPVGVAGAYCGYLTQLSVEKYLRQKKGEWIAEKYKSSFIKTNLLSFTMGFVLFSTLFLKPTKASILSAFHTLPFQKG